MPGTKAPAAPARAWITQRDCFRMGIGLAALHRLVAIGEVKVMALQGDKLKYDRASVERALAAMDAK